MNRCYGMVVFVFVICSLVGACGPKDKKVSVDPHAHEAEKGSAVHAEGIGHPGEGSPGGNGSEVLLSEEQQTLAGVRMGTAEVLPLKERLEVPGNIPEEPDHLISVTASNPCVLTRLLVSVGQDVQAGSVVAKGRAGEGEIEIVSPKAGTVLALPRGLGETIDAYTSVALLADLRTLKVSLSVGEEEASRLRVGQKVQVFHLSNPTEAHDGRVTALSPRVDPETRLVRVGVKVDNQRRHLRLGMYVTAHFMLETGRVVLSVPEGAVQRVAEVETVYCPVPEEADAFLAIPVRTGERRGGRVEILSGLEKGDSLVIEGTFYLKSAQLKGKMGGGDGHGH